MKKLLLVSLVATVFAVTGCEVDSQLIKVSSTVADELPLKAAPTKVLEAPSIIVRKPPADLAEVTVDQGYDIVEVESQDPDYLVNDEERDAEYYNNGTGANATEYGEFLTPVQAAYFDYLVSTPGAIISDEYIDMLNAFVFSGNEDALREFIEERATYGDDYDPSRDCRNPDMAPEDFINICT